MSRAAIRVVKLGGSLLDSAELEDQLQRWSAAQPPMLNVAVVGGGGFVEELRRLDSIHELASSDAHWLAVEMMQFTARAVAIMLTNEDQLTRFTELQPIRESVENRLVILDPLDFLRKIEPNLPGERLPADWSTTSDSIAARLAAALDADELVLLKSTLPVGTSNTWTSGALAAMGFVDAAFPRFAAKLNRVRCVNLRDETFAEYSVDLKLT
jgi:aspartokinase-like uncharacterized kinase